MTRRPSHLMRVLEVLDDYRPHSHIELYALGVIVHSRMSDLKKRGYVIEKWRDKNERSGETVYWYRLQSEPVSAEQREAYLRRPPTSSQTSDLDDVFGDSRAVREQAGCFDSRALSGEDVRASSPDLSESHTQTADVTPAERAPAGEGVDAAASTPGPTQLSFPEAA